MASPRKQPAPHPAADVWPMLPPDELQALADSIVEVGLLEPVVHWADPDTGELFLLDGRNRAAAYEIALSARRPLRPGDMVTYYITGEKATVKAFEAAKPLRAYDPANPDYNVAYYLKKLDENLKKVQGYLAAGADAGPELFEEQ